MIIAKESTRPPVLQITARDLTQAMPKEGEKELRVREGVITRLPGQIILSFVDPKNVMADGIRNYNDVGGIASGRIILEDGSAGLSMPNPNVGDGSLNRIGTCESAINDLIRRTNIAGKNVLNALKDTDPVKKGRVGLKTTETATDDVTFREFTAADVVRTAIPPGGPREIEQAKATTKGKTAKTKGRGTTQKGKTNGDN